MPNITLSAPTRTQKLCYFCGSGAFTTHKAHEMMHGFRDRFDYLECSSCGCIKISAIPKNLAKYYPSDAYYSYHTAKSLRTHLRRLYLQLALGSPVVGRLLNSITRSLTLNWALLFGLERKMHILDVGSGGGLFIRDLRWAGFTGALGIDPFIDHDVCDKAGIAVKRAYLSDLVGEWDRIMFHHSLEHMSDQVGTLKLARAKLAIGGICVVRIPLATWAWRHYGTNWVQLDPPRHLFIHTEKSFRMAASKAGFKVSTVIYDSGTFQFWGSELYKKGIPLKTGEKQLARYFSSQELHEFARRSAELNRQGQGDQAIFLLEPEA